MCVFFHISVITKPAKFVEANSGIQISDCYLKQGAGGMKLHDWGRELGSGGDFSSLLNRISTRNLKNTVFGSKSAVWSGGQKI